MAERGIKWRSPGEVWRAYAEKHALDEDESVPQVMADAERRARAERFIATGGRDLV